MYGDFDHNGSSTVFSSRYESLWDVHLCFGIPTPLSLSAVRGRPTEPRYGSRTHPDRKHSRYVQAAHENPGKYIDFYNCVFHARKSFGNVQISKGLEKSWKIIESFILMSFRNNYCLIVDQSHNNHQSARIGIWHFSTRLFNWRPSC